MEQTESRLAGKVASIMDFFARRPNTSRLGNWMRNVGIALVVATLILSLLAFYWSREPGIFWVNAGPTKDNPISGYATSDTAYRIIETLLDKPGGFLYNDIMPPGVFLDNQPNWEIGVLTQTRDVANTLHNEYGRSQSQSLEDPDLKAAKDQTYFKPEQWIFPRAESQYREAAAHLLSYRNRISDRNDQDAQFIARADNLREWLIIVEKRLGDMSQALTQSVGRSTLNTDLAGDPSAAKSTPTQEDIVRKTSWFKIDDVFFEARGTAWALVHYLRAVEMDFAGVLETKRAEISLRQIIRELEASLEPVNSPIILNGTGYGMFANHSLVMASYLSRANAGVINLRELLDK